MSNRSGAQAAPGPGARRLAGASSGAFAAVIAYAIIEYARPQDLLTPLAALRPGVLASAGLAFFLLRHARLVPWHETRLVVFGLLVACCAAWVPFARNNFWAFQIFYILLQLFLFNLAFVSFVDDRARLRRFLTIWVGAIAYEGIWGMLNGGRGVGYFMEDENDFALSMAMALPFAFFGFRMARGATERAYFLICGTVSLAAMVASASRGGFVALLATTGTLVLISPRRLRSIAFLLVGAALLSLFAPAAYWDEIRTITDTQNATRQTRMHMWGTAWDAFLDNPVLGVGPGNINWNLHFYEQIQDDAPSIAGHATHSLYFTLLPELGMLGLGLYGSLLWLTLRDVQRTVRRARRARGDPLDAVARGALVGLAAYLTGGLFISVLYYPHFYYLMAIALAARRIGEREAWAVRAPVAAEPRPEGAIPRGAQEARSTSHPGP